MEEINQPIFNSIDEEENSSEIEEDSSIEHRVQNSIVQIFNDRVNYDYIRPWKIINRGQSTGTGFCVEIEGHKYILTNAHCVQSTTLLRVQPYGQSNKYQAQIKFVMAAADLALLEINNEAFWQLLKPLQFTYELPALLDTIYVVGYPLGPLAGTNISFTKGVVSRIVDVIYENHGYVNNMAIQIDAAVNPGNSGGPAVDNNGNVVGIAFQGHDEAENMGQIIPSCIYKDLFLYYFKKYGDLPEPHKSIATNKVSELGVDFQTLENPDLRAFYGMPNNFGGVLITNVFPLSNLKGFVLPNDIVLSFNGTKIQADGTVQLSTNSKIHLSCDYLVTNHPPDTSCTMEILRSGKIINVEIVPKYTKKAVEGNFYHSDNQYLIIGGLVFIVPSVQYITQVLNEQGTISPYIQTLIFNFDADREDREIIILSTILPDEINMGYSLNDFNNYHLHKLNGKFIYNLQSLADALDNNTDDYIQLEFFNFIDQSKKIIILNSSKIKNRNKLILKDNLIAYDRSETLRNE